MLLLAAIVAVVGAILLMPRKAVKVDAVVESVYDTVTEPELIHKVNEAKDVISKTATNALTPQMKERMDAAVSTLEGVFDSKFDNFQDIEQTRKGVETFVGNLRKR